MEKKTADEVIYLVDDDGGYAKADGPKRQQYADALLRVSPEWRIATKEEYLAAEKAELGEFAGRD